MIKILVFKLVFKIWQFPQKLRLKNIKNFNIVHVIDIDNTLTIYRGDGHIDHINPIPRSNMTQYVQRLLTSGQKVIFLSARDFRSYSHTIRWLKHQDLLISKNDVYLVPSASHKIEYLKSLIKNNQKIEYIDDLSYNHEKGDIKFYDNVISQVKRMPLTYRGIEFIESI